MSNTYSAKTKENRNWIKKRIVVKGTIKGIEGDTGDNRYQLNSIMPSIDVCMQVLHQIVDVKLQSDSLQIFYFLRQ